MGGACKSVTYSVLSARRLSGGDPRWPLPSQRFIALRRERAPLPPLVQASSSLVPRPPVCLPLVPSQHDACHPRALLDWAAGTPALRTLWPCRACAAHPPPPALPCCCPGMRLALPCLMQHHYLPHCCCAGSHRFCAPRVLRRARPPRLVPSRGRHCGSGAAPPTTAGCLVVVASRRLWPALRNTIMALQRASAAVHLHCCAPF